jgi:hypothetical protein
MLVELVPNRRIAHPLCNLARVLRGKIEHEDGIVICPITFVCRPVTRETSLKISALAAPVGCCALDSLKRGALSWKYTTFDIFVRLVDL